MTKEAFLNGRHITEHDGVCVRRYTPGIHTMTREVLTQYIDAVGDPAQIKAECDRIFDMEELWEDARAHNYRIQPPRSFLRTLPDPQTFYECADLDRAALEAGFRYRYGQLEGSDD